MFLPDIASPLWLGKNGFEIFWHSKCHVEYFTPRPKRTQGQNSHHFALQTTRQTTVREGKLTSSEWQLTSVAVVVSARQSMRGRMLMSSSGLTSMSSCTSSASLGCRGYESDDDLQALTAQVKKFKLRIFIVSSCWLCAAISEQEKYGIYKSP